MIYWACRRSMNTLNIREVTALCFPEPACGEDFVQKKKSRENTNPFAVYKCSESIHLLFLQKCNKNIDVFMFPTTQQAECVAAHLTFI